MTFSSQVGSLSTPATGSSEQAAEADIMRFVAILALCLMLLFSVDQSFRPREAARDGTSAEPVAPAVLPEPQAGPVESGPSARPAAVTAVPAEPPAAPSSFDVAASELIPPPVDSDVAQSESTPAAPVLYFASDVAFLSLLTQGRIEAFRVDQGRWRRLTIGGATHVVPPEPPLYRLRAETVPELLRREIPAGSALTGEWIVRLQEGIDAQVRALLAEPGPAAIVIRQTGRVDRVAPEGEQQHERTQAARDSASR